MKKALFITICATLVTVSCTKVFEQDNEILQPEETASSAIQTLSFSLVFDPETRVTIDSDGKTGWEIGDEILIHGEYINKIGYSVVVTLDGVTNKISADGKTASITITTGTGTEAGTVKPYIHTSGTPAVQDYTSTLYAIYPASAVTDGEHHSYYNNQFKETNTPLMLAYDDGEGHFVFRNLCSMITFTMPNTEDFDYYIFSGNNNEAVSYDTYAAVYAKYSSGSVKNRQGGSYDSSTTTGPKTYVSGPVVCDGATINRVFIPGISNGSSPSNGITFSKGFTFEFVKDGVVTKKISTSNSITLAVADYLPLGDVSSHLKAYSRPAHVSTLSSTKDLSVILGGKANCYYVAKDVAENADETFKFPLYKGNSSEAVSGVDSIELLWESFNNDTKPNVNDVIAAIDFDSSYIYFKMPNPIKAGNAVIAAKNVLGEIMWSWHIWVPETSISNKAGVYSTNMMDRNLGALVATATGTVRTVGSLGLLYQWGRKDPFVGAKSTSSDKFASVAGTAITIHDGYMTLAQSIKNPTLLGKGGGGQDWVSPSDNNLWKETEKTKYDPCPPGYRVPKKDDSQVIHKVLSTQTGWENNTTNIYFTVGSPLSVFPYTGFLDDWGNMSSLTYNSSEQRANLWTATYHYNNVGYGVDVRINGEKCQINDFGKSRGCSVRCVLEPAE